MYFKPREQQAYFQHPTTSPTQPQPHPIPLFSLTPDSPPKKAIPEKIRVWIPCTLPNLRTDAVNKSPPRLRAHTYLGLVSRKAGMHTSVALGSKRGGLGVAIGISTGRKFPFI